MSYRKLQVFISYAHEDISIARAICQRLQLESGIEPWLAPDSLKPGVEWEQVILQKIEKANYVILCWSQNAKREGYIHKEIKSVLERLAKKPERNEDDDEDNVFLIPLRLEDIKLPVSVSKYQYVDFFGDRKDNNFDRVINFLKDKAQQSIYSEEKQEPFFYEEGAKSDKRASNMTQPEARKSRSEVAKINFSILRHFVNRGMERKKILDLLESPYGTKRIAYLVGQGGIGKTKLILQVLSSLIFSKGKDLLIPYVREDSETIRPYLVDFYSTGNRTVDGVMETIIRYLGEDHFAEFRQFKYDTPIVFRNCLQALVKQKPVILAFDTFELVHNDPLANWLLDDSETGLQMPGLICLIGSRPADRDIATRIENLIRGNILIERIEMLGLTYEDALELYYRRTGLDAGWLSVEQEDFIKGLVSKAEGNPLLIELFFDQARQ